METTLRRLWQQHGQRTWPQHPFRRSPSRLRGPKGGVLQKGANDCASRIGLLRFHSKSSDDLALFLQAIKLYSFEKDGRVCFHGCHPASLAFAAAPCLSECVERLAGHCHEPHTLLTILPVATVASGSDLGMVGDDLRQERVFKSSDVLRTKMDKAAVSALLAFGSDSDLCEIRMTDAVTWQTLANIGHRAFKQAPPCALPGTSSSTSPWRWSF